MARQARRWLLASGVTLVILVLIVVGGRTGHLRLVITSTDLANLARVAGVVGPLAGAIGTVAGSLTVAGRRVRQYQRRRRIARQRRREIEEAREARLAYLEALSERLNHWDWDDKPPV